MTTTPKTDPIAQLKALVDKLDPEQRERLEQAGIVVPSGDIGQLGTGRYTWGLRCTHCNKIALYFVGDTWTVNGTEVDEPPVLPANKILWTQALPPDEIDRHKIRCQHCGVLVPMNSDNTFNRTRHRITKVADFEKSRDASRDPKFVKKITRELTKETGAVSVELPQNYHAREASGPVSKVIERQAQERGEVGVLEKLNQLAEATGAAALARGEKNQ